MTAFARLLGMTVTGIETSAQAREAAWLMEEAGDAERAAEMLGLAAQLAAVEDAQAAVKRREGPV